ncbi:MAG: sterol desaturase family protein, partial [Calditrichota bacterium]
MDLSTLRIVCGVITIVGAIVLIALERIIPYNKEQTFFREGFFTDFFWYTLFQSFVMGVIISYLIHYIDTATSISRIEWIREWPLWGQMIFFFLLHDFYIYWFHRWQHHNKFLWRIH